jgi:magnesium chelatase accessory protein
MTPEPRPSDPEILPELPSDWPFRAASRQRELEGIRWHYQQLGVGPALLLVHGTGGATHSWHHCLAALASHYSVTVVDLPGHGFTRVPEAVDARHNVYSLEGMARSLSTLLRAIEVTPVLVAGHSAGVAVLLRMTLDGLIAPARIVGFNPALVAPPDWYVSLIAPMLATIFESRAVADGGAWLARSTGVIRSMLTSTGTTLSADDLARYEYLCRMPTHVHAAMAMMSRWDLPRIVRDAVALTMPLELVAGANDRWVPYAALQGSVARIPAASLKSIDGAGHLLLEERPDVVIAALA